MCVCDSTVANMFYREKCVSLDWEENHIIMSKHPINKECVSIIKNYLDMILFINIILEKVPSRVAWHLGGSVG